MLSLGRHLHPPLSEHFQLDFEPIKLEIPWVISFTVLAPSDGYSTDMIRRVWKISSDTRLPLLES